jgi:hypothetical protein
VHAFSRAYQVIDVTVIRRTPEVQLVSIASSPTLERIIEAAAGTDCLAEPVKTSV